MKRARAARIGGIALLVVVVLAGLAWFGDVPSVAPLDIYENGGGEPLLQSPEIAVPLVRRALLSYGGVPHDAQLTRLTAERAIAFFPDDTSGPSMLVGFDVTFEPRDGLLLRDRILGRVEAVTQQRCLSGDPLPPRYAPRTPKPLSCTHYVLTFPLRVTWLNREWRPWIVRRFARWRDSFFAPTVAPPASVRTTCSHPVDIAALRRIVAAIYGPSVATHLRFDRAHTETLWARAGTQPGATTATWAPPYPTVRLYRTSLTIVAAIVSDAHNRVVTARFTPPLPRTGASVLTFATSDDEPICPPLPPAPELHWIGRAATWSEIVLILRARAEDEMRWRTSYRMPAGRSSVVATDHHAGAVSTVVVETAQAMEGRWRARFTIDERVPEISSAEFVRIGR
jgi:hypothetical protein